LYLSRLQTTAEAPKTASAGGLFNRASRLRLRLARAHDDDDDDD